jgi:hypothetical protein
MVERLIQGGTPASLATQVVAEAFSAGVASAAFLGNPADERWEKSGLMTVLASASPWAGRSIDLSKCAAGSPPPVSQSTDLLGLWPRREHSGSAQRHGVMSRRLTEFHGSPATRSLRICRHSPVRWRSPAAGRRRLVGAMALLEVRPTPNLFLLGLGTNPIDGVYGLEMGQYCYPDHPK